MDFLKRNFYFETEGVKIMANTKLGLQPLELNSREPHYE